MDKIVYGKIYTMDRENPIAEAVGISDGKIVYVGDSSGVEMEKADAQCEYCGGAVLPGFIDTHVHAIPSGLFMAGVDVSGENDIDGIIKKMKELGARTAPGQWILAAKFQDKNIAEKRFPIKEELDSVSTECPVMICHNDTHPFAFNTKAIEMLDLDPKMDGIEVDGDGKVTGFVTDPAFMDVSESMVDLFSDEELLQGYENIDKYAAGNGYTTVFTKDSYRVIKLLFDNQSRFKTEVKPMLRTRNCFDFQSVEKLLNDEELKKITCVCAFGDGAFDSYTGATVEPYEGNPDNFGTLFQTNDELYDYLELPYKNGLQVSCHAIGDNAIDQVLNVYERLHVAYPEDDRRPRIEHFEMPKKAAIKKAARLNCMLGMQPLLIEVCEGMDMEGYRCFVGERVKRCSPYRSCLDEGLVIGGGSDFSVTEMLPLRSAMICMEHPVEEERISLYETLEMFTCNAAKLGFMEHRKGMLKVGMDADIVLLEKNPFNVEPHQLSDIAVEKTIRAGKDVYIKE
ncbi:MAG: amidohydrolase [Clostridiales bacterium]|nr:amidohydrolase [Clostridiales bacterium]